MQVYGGGIAGRPARGAMTELRAAALEALQIAEPQARCDAVRTLSSAMPLDPQRQQLAGAKHADEDLLELRDDDDHDHRDCGDCYENDREIGMKLERLAD